MTSPSQAYNDFEGMRRYNVDGMDVHPISVTSLIKVIAPPVGLVKWLDKKLVNAALESFKETGDIDKARYEGLEARWQSGDEADQGTSVHYLTECADKVLLNQFVDPMTIADQKKLKPYVAQWEKARDAHEIQIIAIEVTLVNPEMGYAGTADRLCIVPAISSNIIPLDIKSGKNIYPDVALQCSALARCTHLLNDDGTMVPIPWKMSSMFGAVAHVRPRSCKIYPLDLTAAWEYFKPLPMLAEWRSEKVPVIREQVEPDAEKNLRADLRRKISLLPQDIADSLRGQIKKNPELSNGNTLSWNLSQLDMVCEIFAPYEKEALERKQRIRDKWSNVESMDLRLKILNLTNGRTASIDDLLAQEVDQLLES